jgi:hypothetical protein
MARYWLTAQGAMNIDTGDTVPAASINPDDVRSDAPANPAQDRQTWLNKEVWAAQAAARKDREAKAALALPDSDDPVILRRKLNAALQLIQR